MTKQRAITIPLWMITSLHLEWADLLVFAGICQNTMGVLDGYVDGVKMAKSLGVGRSTYYLARTRLEKRELIDVVSTGEKKRTRILLTDKTLSYMRKDEAWAAKHMLTDEAVQKATVGSTAEERLRASAEMLGGLMGDIESVLDRLDRLETIKTKKRPDDPTAVQLDMFPESNTEARI